MAYAQWVTITILPDNCDVVLKNFQLDWGKFYAPNNKDAEIDKNTLENYQVKKEIPYSISSCGREDASSGTEGSFNVCDDQGQQICNIYWDCPWGSSTNTFKVSSINTGYMVDYSGDNLDGGALGTVTVEIFKKYA
ncbi:aegerolysin family protein [Clostridium cellulovorans]|uniref:Aegerolysin n=1 Tax=Clostridium cellulovorans (strain ATCC 35296 / DSM 3052 / OCM 3 / 743B) TaxID=573061 RepID=D9SN65_CLOC7|nr:aegerolysin family protein [Clostridium cellulovorans]ADL51931.1 Aegerolysin [Clostridium cellulovorans 743B]